MSNPYKLLENEPIQFANPDDLNAFDKAIPPPTKNKTPQGILLAVCQLQALFFFRERI